jgi:transcriptional regulator with XRE-family HTH domain
MEKAISSKKYAELIRWLHKARIDQNLSMRELADRLGVPHTLVQKVECLERRLDVWEYSLYCQALEIDSAEGLRILSRN